MSKPYLITMDGIEVLARKLGINEVNDMPDLRNALIEIQENLATAMKNVISPEYTLKIIYASDVSKKMDAAIAKVKIMNETAMVVSLDRVYCPNADFYLEVTRETNPLDGTYRIANRFGAPAVDVQMAMLKQMMNDKRRYDAVILTDVGSFEGKTLEFITKEIEKFGIPVAGVVLGASSDILTNKLKNKYNDNGIVTEVVNIDQSMEYEWLEMRDLLLIDGRKVPDSYTADGIRRYIPYTEDLQSFASIPKDKIEECKALCRNSYGQITGMLRNAGVDVKKRVGEFVPLVKSRNAD